ncbi:hypothetical protein EH31_03575 [Erythrobacter longus]|uniref:Uncharacterized protein n=1 Tax=Erythrobacter longus TaxID=1044 RepID=A0A074MIT4_ERYLO|nr:hypothetical protein [Erythrobacter longus]KEO91763.1 hypothetical protein EH31_03575 [Erythrobacter longus]
MEGFNFLLEAFILLMGLAMAQVLGGFARVLKLRTRRRARNLRGIDDTNAVRIGLLTPLLGLFVIVDQSTFFLHMFSFREVMPFNGGTVMGILLTIGWYYLIAAMTFPDEPGLWPDFDEWFWQQKRFVVGGVIGVNVLSTAAQFAFITSEQNAKAIESMTPLTGVAQLFAFAALPMMIWLFFSKSARVCQFLLIGILLCTGIFGALTFTTQQPG